MAQLATTFPRTASANRITQALIESAWPMAKACNAKAIFVYADALQGGELPLPEVLRQMVYYVSKTPGQENAQKDRGTRHLRVPDVPLTRLGQVKIATFLALSRGLIKRGDVVVFLAGVAASGTLDTVMVTEVGREFEMLSTTKDETGTPSNVDAAVVERVLEVATDLGAEGREGKPVGALFVVGDSERVCSLSKQLILNPFRGYPEEQRNILDEGLEETVKELATVDGAFIIRGDGTIQTCGAFLKVASQDEWELPRGLGARHHAAAAITAVSDSIAVTVSESTGTVTAFRQGSVLVQIEKPHGSRLHRTAS